MANTSVTRTHCRVRLNYQPSMNAPFSLYSLSCAAARALNQWEWETLVILLFYYIDKPEENAKRQANYWTRAVKEFEWVVRGRWYLLTALLPRRLGSFLSAEADYFAAEAPFVLGGVFMWEWDLHFLPLSVPPSPSTILPHHLFLLWTVYL